MDGGIAFEWKSQTDWVSTHEVVAYALVVREEIKAIDLQFWVVMLALGYRGNIVLA